MNLILGDEMFRVFAFVALLLAPSLAFAADPPAGFYIGGDAGGNFAESLESSQNNTKITTSLGPVALGAIGYRFGDGLRVELEGSYRENSISSVSTLRKNGEFLGLTNVSGNLSTYAAMANVAYDLPFHAWRLQPYVGAGLGVAWLDLSNAFGNGFGVFHLPNNNTFTGPSEVTFGTADALAYQFLAGASMRLTSSLDMTFEYRFFGSATARLPINRVEAGGVTVNGVIPSSSQRNGFSALDSAILLGLRYHFGGP